jgi:hypothetical protein
MKNLFIISLISILPIITHAVDVRFNPPLMTGQCAPDVDSKRYHQDLSTETTHAYSCEYRCLDPKAGEIRIRAMSTESKQAAAVDGMAMLCDGVLVVQILRGERWLWDFDRVQPFWAAANLKPEIQNWVRTNDIRIPEPYFTEIWQKFSKATQQIVGAYLNSQNQTLIAAAQMLIEIEQRTEVGRFELARLVKILREDPNAFKKGFGVDQLVMATIVTQAPYLINLADFN